LESGQNPVFIDGAEGEGGGQILRTALTLSLITGRPFRMVNIRANRPNPGLRAQHLQCVRASARMSGGKCENAAKGAVEIEFTPGSIAPGDYDFSIGTAGSTSLLLHTLLLPLAFAGGGTLRLSGGTHVNWAPVFDYLAAQYLPFLEKLGISARASLLKAGFYPKGGGQIEVEIHSSKAVSCASITNRGELKGVCVTTVISNLRLEIAQRMNRHALKLLQRRGIEASEEIEPVASPGPGVCAVITADFEGGRACYSALGERGRRAEKVAKEAVEKLFAFLETDACVDEYLADQLLVPLALAEGESHFTTPKVTNHLLTNAATIRKFLPVTIEIDGIHSLPGSVRITGAATPKGDKA
jgi:RNA 3'-terminal phosphate cyclase (ATP)